MHITFFKLFKLVTRDNYIGAELTEFNSYILLSKNFARPLIIYKHLKIRNIGKCMPFW